ncbi:MAG: redoxin family protein [Acidobacteriota bacterium]
MLLVLGISLAPTGSAASPQSLAKLASLKDTQGLAHSAAEWRDKKAIVIFFMMTDCPLANASVPEMNRIAAEYGKQGIVVYADHADPTVGDAAVRKHAEEFAYKFPILLDSKLELARAVGARVSPEVAVLSPSGAILYLGRIDNRVEDLTHPRQFATQHELRNALDDIVNGRKPTVATTRAVGCSILVEGDVESIKGIK